MNIGHLGELERRFRNMEKEELEVAAHFIDSDTLRNELIDRGELIDGISLDLQREICDQLPDYMLFERITNEHFMFKDTIGAVKQAPRKMYHKYKDQPIEMRKGDKYGTT